MIKHLQNLAYSGAAIWKLTAYQLKIGKRMEEKIKKAKRKGWFYG